MPSENIIYGENPVPFPGSPDAQPIGFIVTGTGNALQVAITGAPIVIDVNLDLADDEVAIGGPDSGGTRRLFQGRVEGANNLIETVPRMIGAQADALGKAEDTAAVAADVGVPAWAVRRDADGPQAGDGDYTELQVDATGRLKVDGGGAGGGVHAEDSVAASGANGVFALGVRRDADAPTAGDGDYSELQTDANGRLKTALRAEHAEDSVHTTGDVGVQALTVRDDFPPTPTAPSGDYAPILQDERGRIYTEDAPTRFQTQGAATVAVAAVSVAIGPVDLGRRTLRIYNAGPGPLYLNQTGAAATVADLLIPRGSWHDVDPMSAAAGCFGISNSLGAAVRYYTGTL